MVYINGRFLTQPVTGVNRFALEICKALAELRYDFRVVVPGSVGNRKDLPFELCSFGNLTSHFWEQIDLLRFLRKEGTPLLVNLSGLGPLYYRNQIITIHDLSFYRQPEWFSRPYRMFYSFATPVISRSAQAIITVSEFSKGEIIKYLNTDPGKIVVVPNAVSANITQDEGSGMDKEILKKKYLLAVSSLDPRKNHQRLIEAFGQDGFKDYNLLLVGKGSRNFNVRLETGDNSRIKFLGYISDADLSLLYKRAELFVYPSLYEGFGIPPLEAMANGCAVVVSDIESLREVCGDAAEYVNPQSASSIGEGVLNVLHDEGLRGELVSRGMKRAAYFSWQRSAERLLALLSQINHEVK